MLLRQAILAVILVSGTAAAAAAQSGQFPFRRFGTRHWVMPRIEMRPYRFSMRDHDRFMERADRLRFRLDERSHRMADGFRMRGMRNRSFEWRDGGRHDGMEFRFRDGDRIRDRIRDRMDHFRFERPMMRRRFGAI